jgi:hypothetical protein
VVQVVILAEDNDIREKLRQHDIIVQTIDEVAPIEVQPARVLSHLYTYLGELNAVLTPGVKNCISHCFPYYILRISEFHRMLRKFDN